MVDNQVRGRILEVARVKFERFGVRRVTMDEIARELGMSKKTLYKGFTGKEDLVRELVARGVAHKMKRVVVALNSPGSPAERFVACFSELRRVAGSLSAVFLTDVRRDYPAQWEIMETQRTRVTAGLIGVIRDGVLAGEIRQGINPEIAAGIVQCVVRNFLVPETFHGADFTPHQAMETWHNLLAGGLWIDAESMIEALSKVDMPESPESLSTYQGER